MSQGVPFYHISMDEKLLAVGLHHMSRTLPGVTRFGGAHVGARIAGTANPNLFLKLYGGNQGVH